MLATILTSRFPPPSAWADFWAKMRGFSRFQCPSPFRRGRCNCWRRLAGIFFSSLPGPSPYSVMLRMRSDHRWRRDCQPRDTAEDRCEQISRHRDLGQLECDVLRVPSNLHTNLDELLPQCRKRPLTDALGNHQPPLAPVHISYAGLNSTDPASGRPRTGPRCFRSAYRPECCGRSRR